jgi:pSer/pThr/pTyr-binding forkhead associated (FHA) protein
MSICSRCGTEAAPTDRFCKKCGQRFDVRDADFARAERAPVYVPATPVSWQSDVPASSVVSHASATSAASMLEGGPRPSASPISGGSAVAVAVATVPAVARLLVRSVSSSDPADVREYALDGHDVAIGRSPSCDIRLEGDQLISRRHALMRYDGERYTIVDLGSSNGTYVNDVEITEAHPLAEGDRMLLGEHELVYSTTPASATAAMAGAHLREAIPMRTPAPRTEPHPIAVLLPDAVPQPSSDASLMDLEPAEPTIPKSDLTATESIDVPSDAPRDTLKALPEMPEVWPNASDMPDAPSTSGVPGTSDAPTVLAPVAPGGDLENFHAQVTRLMATVDGLAQRTEQADRQAEQWHAALGEVRERLTGLINELQRVASDADEDEELAPLTRVVRQAADNPRHVDYMMQLADSAGDILAVLELRQARQSAPLELLNALTTLRAWIYRLG